MAENIPLLNESMNGARLAGVVDYLRHQKRDVYYGFVGPAREEGQPTNKANQAYFTQRDWLGGETLQRGAEDLLVGATLRVRPGAKLGLVGPNGAGKVRARGRGRDRGAED